MTERALKAKEIARPIAETVDWYIDKTGVIFAIHQTEPISTEERLAIIAYVLANDVLNMESIITALKAQLAAERKEKICQPNQNTRSIVKIAKQIR